MKTRYKEHLLRESVEAYGNIVELSVQAEKLKKGRKGLKVGCQATILDASNILSKCWQEFESATIIGCWIHSKCLSHTLPEIGETSCRSDEEMDASTREVNKKIAEMVVGCYPTKCR